MFNVGERYALHRQPEVCGTCTLCCLSVTLWSFCGLQIGVNCPTSFTQTECTGLVCGHDWTDAYRNLPSSTLTDQLNAEIKVGISCEFTQGNFELIVCDHLPINIT